jgi:hypothetical protein
MAIATRLVVVCAVFGKNTICEAIRVPKRPLTGVAGQENRRVISWSMTSLASLPTPALFRDLEALVTAHRACTASIVRHLAEVELRGAHLERGYSTLFSYCSEALHFSEDEAYRRIEASRLLRRFPIIGDHLQSGAVSLSVVCALKHHLTSANHQELLAGVRHLSRRKAEEWLARRFPRLDVPESVRRLPVPSPSSLPPTPMPVVAEAPLPTTAKFTQPSFQTRRRPGILEPRSADRFALHVTVSRAVKEQLDLARDLMRHRNADGDLETVIAAAFAALIERLEIKKLGSTRDRGSSRRIRPSKEAKEATQPRQRSSDKDSLPDALSVSGGHPGQPCRTKRSRIGNAIRREVVARDGIGCSYVGPDGRRCGSCAFLEFDHVNPERLGGASDAKNLRLLCRAHNQAEAERIYGKEFMKRARKLAARGSKTRAASVRETVSAPGAETQTSSKTDSSLR